jgi:signal peptidase I
MFFKKKTQAPPKPPKSFMREWGEAAFFAIFAATFIRWIFLEAYKIPTPSMEKSLLVGDFLFVSKFHYGARTPQTPLQLPLTHQTMWFSNNVKSYLDWVQLPMYRLPGFSEIKRNDVVVFNYPPGGDHPFKSVPPEKEYPADLKTNYIKRCVAIAGDELSVKDQQVYVNGQPSENAPKMQHSYIIAAKQVITDKTFLKYDITDDVQDAVPFEYIALINPEVAEKFKDQKDIHYYVVNTLPETVKTLKTFDFIAEVVPVQQKSGMASDRFFAKSEGENWNQDNFGTIFVPKAGAKVEMTPKNVALYGYLIKKYEYNENVELKGDKIFIGGKEIQTYEFKQNYYFMMGDNRHNSLDSRYWGFVPEDHIVGKGFMIWLSLDPNGEGFFSSIRWDRIGKFIE